MTTNSDQDKNDLYRIINGLPPRDKAHFTPEALEASKKADEEFEEWEKSRLDQIDKLNEEVEANKQNSPDNAPLEGKEVQGAAETNAQSIDPENAESVEETQNLSAYQSPLSAQEETAFEEAHDEATTVTKPTEGIDNESTAVESQEAQKMDEGSANTDTSADENYDYSYGY